MAHMMMLAFAIILAVFTSGTYGSFFLYSLTATDPVTRPNNVTVPAHVQCMRFFPTVLERLLTTLDLFFDSDTNASTSCAVDFDTSSPPTTAGDDVCQNNNMSFAFPANTWKGSSNFRLALWYDFINPKYVASPLSPHQYWLPGTSSEVVVLTSTLKLTLADASDSSRLGPYPYDYEVQYSEVNITEGNNWKCSRSGACRARRPIEVKVMTEWGKKKRAEIEETVEDDME